MFQIKPFESKYLSELIELIEKIQAGEFNIPIFESQRQELADLTSAFQKNKGNYWIALFNEKGVGSIAVMDIGDQSLELRDVFLIKDLRSK